MKQTVFVLWNIAEDRPVIMENNYGGLCVYLTKEQAQASRLNEKDDFAIREMTLEGDEDWNT